jgi:hypothetical protein
MHGLTRSHVSLTLTKWSFKIQRMMLTSFSIPINFKLLTFSTTNSENNNRYIKESKKLSTILTTCTQIATSSRKHNCKENSCFVPQSIKQSGLMKIILKWFNDKVIIKMWDPPHKFKLK